MIYQYNLSIQSLIDDYNVFNRNLMNINDIICPIIEIRGISYDCPQDDITRIMYKTTNNKIKVICSRSHPNDEFKHWLDNNLKSYKIIKIGSSIKFCYLAEEKAHIYPRLRPTSEWDIAAGHIILNEAGGRIRTLDNKEMLYNVKENVKNPYFIASGLKNL